MCEVPGASQDTQQLQRCHSGAAKVRRDDVQRCASFLCDSHRIARARDGGTRTSIPLRLLHVHLFILSPLYVLSVCILSPLPQAVECTGGQRLSAALSRTATGHASTLSISLGPCHAPTRYGTQEAGASKASGEQLLEGKGCAAASRAAPPGEKEYRIRFSDRDNSFHTLHLE